MKLCHWCAMVPGLNDVLFGTALLSAGSSRYIGYSDAVEIFQNFGGRSSFVPAPVAAAVDEGSEGLAPARDIILKTKSSHRKLCNLTTKGHSFLKLEHHIDHNQINL